MKAEKEEKLNKIQIIRKQMFNSDFTFNYINGSAKGKLTIQFS